MYPCVGFPLKPELRQFGEQTILHQCVDEKTDVMTLQRVLHHRECPNLNIRNLAGRTALQEAVMRGFDDLVMELFNKGADVRIRDASGNSALHVRILNHLITSLTSLLL